MNSLTRFRLTLMASVLAACGSTTAPDSAPANVSIRAADGAVVASFDAVAGLSYTLYCEVGSVLEPITNIQGAHASVANQLTSPVVLTSIPAALTHVIDYDKQVACALGASRGGSRLGPLSPTAVVTPRAGATTWIPASPVLPADAAVNGVAFDGSRLWAAADGGKLLAATWPASGSWAADVAGITPSSVQRGSGNLNAVDYHLRYTVVGDAGKVLVGTVVNTELISWTVPDSKTTQNLRAVAGWIAGGVTTVAVGDNGTIIRSTDGANWTLITGETANLRAIATNGTRWVAVGDGGKLMYSSDGGASWFAGQGASAGSTNLRAVVAGSVGNWTPPSVATPLWIAVGDSGLTLTSTDGITWTAGGSSGLDLVAITSSSTVPNRFVATTASGQTVYTGDGVTWTASATPPAAVLPSGSTVRTIAFQRFRYLTAGTAGASANSEQ